MNINGRNFDVEAAIHAIALEYSKFDLQAHLQDEPEIVQDPQHCSEFMFHSYLRAYGHLSQQSDECIKTLLQSV